MENATNALLMAFAVLIFIIALSVTLTTLSQAKSTADIVLFYSDRENFQTPMQYDALNYEDGGRTVGADTVIATIARCAKEKFSVKIIEDEKTYIFEYDIQTETEIKTEIDRFIQEHTGTHTGTSYRETYVEVTTSGKTYFGVDETGTKDGTQLEEDVGKKIYIIYTKQ